MAEPITNEVEYTAITDEQLELCVKEKKKIGI